MANYHFLKAVNRNSLTVVNTDDMRFVNIDKKQIKNIDNIDNFDTKQLKYKGEDIRVDASKGTIVFRNKSDKTYGILARTSFDNVILRIVKFSDIDEYITKHKTCNIKLQGIVDITPDFDIIAKTNGYVKSISEYVSKKQEQKSAEDTNEEFIKEQKEYLGRLCDVEEGLRRRESSIEKMEADLSSKLNEANSLVERLSEAICKTESLSAYSAGEIILDVKDIFTFKKPVIKPKSKQIIFPHYTYELILKSVSTGDIINIPLSYFETLEVFRIRLLEKSNHDTGYAAIEKIKFNKHLDEFIVAIVEFKKKEVVTLYICNEYGTDELTDKEIVYYTANYTNMRKKVKMIFEE